MASPPPFPAVKIFGERGSGTNFVAKLLTRNFAVEEIPSIRRRTAEQARLIEAIPKARRRGQAIMERIQDAAHLAQMPENGRWKHACLTERVFRRFRRADEVLFVCVVRHPALWARSFFENPYGTFTGPAPDLDAFLATPWVTRPRDEVPAVILEGPADLWRLKVASYLDQAAARANVVVVRHEDVLGDHVAVLERLSALLTPAGGGWQVPAGYARHWLAKVRDFWSIRKALPAEPFDAVPPGAAALLRRRIGDDLIARAGYAVPGVAGGQGRGAAP